MDLPHTISFAIQYRERLNSFNELPKDKRPPRNLWDKPYALGNFLESIWDTKEKKSNNFYQYDVDELE